MSEDNLMRTTPRWSLCALVTSGCTAAAFGQVAYETVVLKDQPAPGTPSTVKFQSFLTRPVLNANGQPCFIGNLTGTGVTSATNSGVWAGIGSELQLCVREGAAAPGTSSGVTFSGFLDTVYNANGQVLIQATLRGTGVTASNDSGLWAGTPDNIGLVAREGGAVPGVSGAAFAGMSSPVFNNRGEIAFFAVISGTGVNHTNDVGIWMGPAGGLALVAREGSQAADLPAGTLYGSVFGPVINHNGAIAFRSTLQGTGVDTTNDIGVWAGLPNNLKLVARKGQQAPGLPSGVKWLVPGDPAINDAGQIAFVSLLTGTGVTSANDKGIWSGTAGNFSMVTRKGAQAPGTASGVTFADLNDPVLSGSGHVSFRAVITGPGVTSSNDEGFWAGTASNLRLVAREGAQAPGYPAGVVFKSFITLPTMNSLNQMAFLASVAGPGITTANDQGIFATTLDGTLILLAAEGAPIQVAPGDQRTVATINLIYSPSGGQDGRFMSLNDAGKVVFYATFTDGSQGIFLATIPSTPVDSDGDGTPDGSDGCPNDPNKIAPGACGCGVPDTDSDGDGVADCIDVCPGHNDTVDPDGDGVPSGCDNCPNVPNPDQADSNGNGIGDACETAPQVSVRAWRSVRAHGTAGNYAIPLNATASGNGATGPSVEPRAGGIQRIEIDFSGPITLADPAGVSITGRTTTNGVLGSVNTYSPTAVTLVDSDTLALIFEGGLPDATCYRIELLPTLVSQTLTGDLDVQIRSLVGDASGDGVVLLDDALMIKDAVVAGVTAATMPHCDVNLSNANINLGDAILVKSRMSNPARQALCP